MSAIKNIAIFVELKRVPVASAKQTTSKAVPEIWAFERCFFITFLDYLIFKEQKYRLVGRLVDSYPEN